MRALAVLAILLPAVALPATYHRSETTVRLAHAVRPVTLARTRTPEDSDTARYFIANEIAALARCEPDTVLPAGRRVRLPRYVRVSRSFSGDLRNWHVAVICGNKYNVSPSLLVAMRTHECPLQKWDHKALGVKNPSGGGWWPGGIWGQYAKAADIVHRRAVKWGCDGDDPTREFVYRLGRYYAEGSESWGVETWAIRQRILRRVD